MCVSGSDSKEKTSVSHRARAIRAKEEGVPAADFLRSVSPSEYLPAVRRAREAFDGQGSEGGFVLVRVLSVFGAFARPAASWANKLGASDESDRVLQSFDFALGLS